MVQENRLDAVTLRVASAADYKAIQRLCDERYGKGYLDREAFAHWLQTPELFRVALAEGAFAGFAVLVPATVPELMESMGMPEAEVRAIVGEKPALIYKSAALETRFEHRGIMKKTLAALLERAVTEGYGSVFGSAWVMNGTLPIGGIFRTFGFQYLYNRPMLWYHYKNYRCIVCNGRCRCDAAIYYKKL